MANEINVGDVGVDVIFTIYDGDGIYDLSSIDQADLTMESPNRESKSKTGDGLTGDMVFLTDGTDGKIRFVSEASDFDVDGLWKAQIKITEGAASWRTNLIKIPVHPSLL